MNLFTRNSPYYHLIKYLLFLLKHPVYAHTYIYLHTIRGTQNYVKLGNIYRPSQWFYRPKFIYASYENPAVVQQRLLSLTRPFLQRNTAAETGLRSPARCLGWIILSRCHRSDLSNKHLMLK